MHGEWIVALAALATMEIVLGIDNVVFLAIVTARLPVHQQSLARRVGLALALVMRIALLVTIKWILQLDEPIVRLTEWGVPSGWLQNLAHPEAVDGLSIKDLILLLGGMFLIAKSVKEMHEKLEHPGDSAASKSGTTFAGAIAQIVVLDLIFSLDSVITAVGMAEHLWIMITAICIAMGVMLVFANPISNFVGRHPTLTMLALSFLILIGVMLVAEGIGTHFNKKYIYFAMAFALLVEMLNLRVRSRSHTASGGTGNRPQK